MMRSVLHGRPLWQRSACAVFVLGALLTSSPARGGEEAPNTRAHRLETEMRGWIRVAAQARPGIVRVRWRDATDGVDHSRQAIAVDARGHLLTTGDEINAARSLLAVDVPEAREPRKARVVARDAESGLILLRLQGSGPLPVLPLRPPTPEARERPISELPTPPTPKGPERTNPLASLPLGLDVGLVTWDGALARGTIRATDRRVSLGTSNQTVSGLLEAALAALPSDMGAPWLDAKGRVVALQLGAGIARPVPAVDAEAKRRGVHMRPFLEASRAVPVSVIRVVLPLLVASGRVERAGLGIVSQPASEAVRAHLTNGAGGHLITFVEPGGPAARAGLRSGDLIVRIAGEALRPDARLSDLMLPFRPGQEIQVRVLRAGRPVDVRARLLRRR
jgi:S1-C subfamily serine protease